MSRFSEIEKRSIVERYLSGDESYASAGAAAGIDAATVRKWVALYQAHGDAGLLGKYDHYDAAFKLSVLERMWGEGLSYRQTALFNIRNAGCLAGWEKRYHAGGIEALAPRPRGRPRSMPKPAPGWPAGPAHRRRLSDRRGPAKARRGRAETPYVTGTDDGPVPLPVRLWQEEVHKPGLYDLEVDTSALTPEACAAAIRQRLIAGPEPTAFQTLARLLAG
ncbi:helix-turn-helix domain-containing protein [Mesorhizobium sp. MSK_1335]|uniref:Helix-turn-helix domain-containing protein n=1 Tax=Mesorhizobium montanum TaxID=3072323 RepID=A0ABU4ZLN2_9HYPH|nr:helix-turn-helix domain-containing protein [Mesorhizobium sp. MSK_1335]MDX8524921.1 helix-turn-helix domain-containing protein [Mesorhizobium sp. MSK_1335]